MSSLAKCPACHEKVSQEAISCPHCGHPFRASKQSVSSGVFSGLATFFIGLPIICLGGIAILAMIAYGCDTAQKRSIAEAESRATEQRRVVETEARKRMEEEKKRIESSPEWIAAQEKRIAEEKDRARLEMERQEAERQRTEEERLRPIRERQRKIIAYQVSQASNGLPSFQLELGRRYMRGDGVETNLALARHWLQSACTNGESQASNLLSKIPTF